MPAGFSGTRIQAAKEEDACVAGASIADVLRLLSSGATGAILMALGEGPLRTKGLTERVPGYAPRTIYRYAGKLAELDVVEREEEPGVPSKVVHTLTEGCGRELHDLVERYANASLSRLPNGQVISHAWASLGLLADLWESGMVEELSCDPRSPTELARGSHEFSYHQVNRRAGLFAAAGLLSEYPGAGRRRCYALTDKTRRAMALIAGIGCWRHHHVVAEDEEGMAAAEMATLLRASLQLVRVPRHAGKCPRLNVVGDDEPHGAEGEAVWAEVEDDGRVHSCAEPTHTVDGWARGKTGAWISVTLDGDAGRLLVGGDAKLICDSLEELHRVLWTPAASPSSP
jgi:DNA-binding HxlR family transcriptional regulator